jgi:ABC-2 type transport system permease protein
MLPVVVVSNAPASTLLHGFDLRTVGWLLFITVLWLGLAVLFFHRGLRRYSSASS